MTDDTKTGGETGEGVQPLPPALPQERRLSDAAKRALAEAEARRQVAAEMAKAEPPRPREINGPKGPEPTRYGDWECKGIARDF